MQMRPLIETKPEAGFSLLETLFALAIMSLASVALFQSTSSMLGLSDRAVKAGERTVNGGLDRLAVRGIIEGLLPNWPTEPEGLFKGEPRSLQGLTSGGLHQEAALTEIVTLSFDARPNGTESLIYTSAKADQGWEIMAGLPQDTRFEYMGVDQSWYAVWPPKDKPLRGHFDDSLQVKIPSLPQAVRAKSGDYVLWTARISRAAAAPVRFDPEVGL